MIMKSFKQFPALGNKVWEKYQIRGNVVDVYENFDTVRFKK